MDLVKHSDSNRTGPTTLNSTQVRRQLDFVEPNKNSEKISVTRSSEILRVQPRLGEAKIDKISIPEACLQRIKVSKDGKSVFCGRNNLVVLEKDHQGNSVVNPG